MNNTSIEARRLAVWAVDNGILIPPGDIMACRSLANLCYQQSRNAGWWNDPASGDPVELTPELIASKLMLIVSEVAEAMEGHRKDLMDDKLPHRKMLEVELADAVIRINDLAGRLGLDITGAMIEKMAFNATRPDHKPENRAKANGKKY